MISLTSIATSLIRDSKNGKETAVVKHPSVQFYHYRCDGINDTGWGCGYRSLQTMCSWAVVDRDDNHAPFVPPTLEQIQKTLVEVGDKEHSFVGSKEWIGCYEASIVLNQLYEVSCKILHVTSGSKVIEVCEQLLTHFKSIGSPVMIGGDRDASSKTLIGIEFDKDTNTWAFLIADPHYIGSDNVEAIVDGRGVQWHNISIFEHSSFYNFCIPIK